MERRIIFLEEKHGNRCWLADTDEDLERSAKAIVKERLEAGGYYFDDWKQEAMEVLISPKKQAAWNFLQNRSGYEYESVDLMYTEEAKEGLDPLSSAENT
jgi:hypothetical protein